jgi:transcriptional regulator with XRE-family HTH domain
MDMDEFSHDRRRLRWSGSPWRIFLSHTSELRDFPEERSFIAAAEAAVIRAGHAVTDMAYFTARDNVPADHCERMVADASVYVGIVGLRYGTPVRGRPDRSYTELEYETATSLGLPRLVFMTRPGSPSPPTISQPVEQTDRQEAFRRRLLEQSDVTVAWIASPSDLEIALFQALVELGHDLSVPKHPNRLRQLRGNRFTQEEMAERAEVDLSTYRGWEKGEHRPRPRAVRALCEILDVEEHQLGFRPPPDLDAGPRLATHRPSSDASAAARSERHEPPVGAIPDLPAAILASQAQWRKARRHLAAHGAALTSAAADLYPQAMRVEGTPLLTRESWMAVEPVDMGSARLDWLDGPQHKVVVGTEAEVRLLLPLRAPGHQFESFTAAVRYLDRPTLFENRPTFRLLDASVSVPGSDLRFSLGTYFEMVDVAGAVAHEMAAAHVQSAQTVSLRRLAFRSLIGDPLDLRRRPVQAAINALTIRWDGGSGTASFLLHWRDPAKVAVGGGLYSVMPVGVFQPSTVDPWGQRLDFDLWRNLVREFSEEFLGMPEHDGSSGVRIDYDMWPLYRTLTSARDAGRLRVHCFGLGVDPLGLGVDLLTAVVIDSEVFDAVLGDRVQVNAEGLVITHADDTAAIGFPFTEESVHRFVRTEPMGPGGAACLALAWRHRQSLF